MTTKSYWEPIIADNRALENAGMPYRWKADGYAVCAECGQLYFRADRSYPDCEHYDPLLEQTND